MSNAATTHADSVPAEQWFVALAADHAEPLARLFARNARSAGLFDPFPLTAETAARIACAPRADRYFGALPEGASELVGLTMLRGWDEGFEVPSFGILIDRRHRGTGLGRWMTEMTLETARRLGCRQVRLSVYASNHVALGLYSRLGFTEVEREVQLVRGSEEERIVMVLDLASRR